MSNNVSQNSTARWIDHRLPVVTAMNEELIAYPTPRNLNYWWNFGSLSGFVLVTMILSGVFLAMNYVPTAEGAFDSVQRIMRDVPSGWLVRYIHTTGASMFFLVVYIHLFRGLYYGSYKAPRELLWMLGVVILLLMMATAFLGYTLPWGQMSYWGATVITNLFSAIPVIGDPIVTWLWGGYSVDSPTLNRFYALHYLLPFVIVGVTFLHLVALHRFGSNNPLGIDADGPQDKIPFHPYYTVKDGLGLAVFLIVYVAFIFFAPDALLAPENSIPANPFATPADIVPEWYFGPFFGILRAIPDKLLGVIAMFGAILVLFLLPWLDTSRVRSGQFRPVFKVFFWVFVVDCLVLGIAGNHPPEGTWLAISRLTAAYYFAHFLVVLPLVGKFETTQPLPASIATPVLTTTRNDG